MENNNINIPNQEEKITMEEPQKPDYYITTGRKVGDFLLGFFGVAVLSFIYTFVSSFVYSLLSSQTFSIAIWANFFVSVIILVLLAVLFFKIGRRFIAIGVISISLLPILIFGSCILLLG
jgi:hypothetical protein